MISGLALVIGALVGFVGSRALRRSGGVGGSGRSAPELQRACFDAAVGHVQRGRDGQRTLPSSFRLAMHPDDLATVDEARGWFTDGLVSALEDAAREHGWQVTGPIRLDLAADPSRRRGAPIALAARSSAPATERARPTATPSASPSGARRTASALVLVSVDGGTRLPVPADVARIGRASSCEVTVDDKRVSRHHATLRRARGGWTVTDEGSANGTSLNGRRLDPGTAVPVRAGDALGLGPVGFTVRADPGGGS